MLRKLVNYRKWWYLISVLLVIPGTIALATLGLKLGIDFTGGSLLELQVPAGADSDEVREAAEGPFGDPIVQETSDDTFQIRVSELNPEEHNRLLAQIEGRLGEGTEELRFESVGPAISRDLRNKAILSVGLGSLLILMYIAYAFRNVPKPASSWRFGATTIVTLLHDVLFTLGVFALLGKFAGVAVDINFVAALLTVIGYSVHDTIVVFDRIRENLVKRIGGSFPETVNYSIAQSLVRSINTSVTVLLVLFALYFFGGESLQGFVLALLIGTAIGTYSSIFNAAPLLVTWQRWSDKRAAKRNA
ncbi:MAG: protein translocase subunit SecF [Patescibacteria group bacterium]